EWSRPGVAAPWKRHVQGLSWARHGRGAVHTRWWPRPLFGGLPSNAVGQRFCSRLLGLTGLPLRRSPTYSAGRPWPPELPTLATGSPRLTRAPASLSSASL